MVGLVDVFIVICSPQSSIRIVEVAYAGPSAEKIHAAGSGMVGAGSGQGAEAGVLCADWRVAP